MTDDPEGDDEPKVGYKQPPTKTQFKKGRSGNPKGRPKSSSAPPPRSRKKFFEVFYDELHRPVEVSEGGACKTVPFIQVLIRNLGTAAMKDPRMLKLYLLMLPDAEKLGVEDFTLDLSALSEKELEELLRLHNKAHGIED